MAFPGDYSTYQEVTIDNIKVDADLTDFPIYIDLSDLDKGGNDIFDTCRSDGGDIRVTKSDGTTQLPREVVSIDTTGKTGELHVKYTGTLSSSSDTTIRIYYNGTDTEPASDSTYGSEAVWSDYEFVSHDGGGTDSTGNYTPSANGGVTAGGATGKLGDATDFDGSNDYFDLGSAVVPTNGDPWSVALWASFDETASNKYAISQYQNGASGRTAIFYANDDGGGGYEYRFFNSGSGTIETFGSATAAFKKLSLSVADNSDIEAYSNGVSIATDTGLSNVISVNTLIGAGFDSNGVTVFRFWNGVLDEVRIKHSEISDDWESTEYNNQNSPSTFYSTGDEVGGASFTPKVMMF